MEGRAARGVVAATFQLSVDDMRAWSDALAPHRSQRGVDEVMLAMTDAMGAATGGQVTVNRHQLWTWAQSLEGQARKLPLAAGEQVRNVAAAMQTILNGGTPPKPATEAAMPPAPPTVPPSTATPPPPVVYNARPVAPAYVPPPPVTYLAPGATPTTSAASTSARLVVDREIAGVVGQLLRDARQEVLIVSPWRAGLDTLADTLLTLPREVAVRALSRRPEPEDAEYHRKLPALRARGIDLVMSPHIHTRLVMIDRRTLLIGAASVPPAGATWSREMALLTSEPALVQAALQQFAQNLEDARNGR